MGKLSHWNIICYLSLYFYLFVLGFWTKENNWRNGNIYERIKERTKKHWNRSGSVEKPLYSSFDGRRNYNRKGCYRARQLAAQIRISTWLVVLKILYAFIIWLRDCQSRRFLIPPLKTMIPPLKTMRPTMVAICRSFEEFLESQKI